MDKLVPKPAENAFSAGKSELSDSSTNLSEVDTFSEPLPDSALELLIPSNSKTTKIVLVGTAHVSEKSVAEVKYVIRKLKPDVVAVELCGERSNALEGKSQEEQVPIKDLLSGGKLYYYLIHWLLAHLQKKIGEDKGIKPGAEMIAAMKEAETIGAKVALIDRDVQVTLQRFWGKMKFLEKIKMMGSLLGCFIHFGKGNDLDIDQMTEQEVVTELVNELRGSAPTAAKVLIDERDAYLAGNIIKTAENGGKTIVVVIGAGHKTGVFNYLKNPKSIPPLDTLIEIPKKSLGIGKIVSAVFVGIIIAFFALLLLSGVSPQLFFTAFLCWFIITGVLSALGALLAGGHRDSVLTSFLIAWITTPHPGWFSGLVEAKKLNPKTSDIKALLAVEKFGDIFKNSLMRVLLVASLTNIGSIVGAFLGLKVIILVTGTNPNDIIFAGLKVLGL